MIVCPNDRQNRASQICMSWQTILISRRNKNIAAQYLLRVPQLCDRPKTTTMEGGCHKLVEAFTQDREMNPSFRPVFDHVEVRWKVHYNSHVWSAPMWQLNSWSKKGDLETTDFTNCPATARVHITTRRVYL